MEMSHNRLSQNKVSHRRRWIQNTYLHKYVMLGNLPTIHNKTVNSHLQYVDLNRLNASLCCFVSFLRSELSESYFSHLLR